MPKTPLDFKLADLEGEYKRFLTQFAKGAEDKVQALATEFALETDELLRKHGNSPNLPELIDNVAIQGKQKAAALAYDLESEANAEAFRIGIQTLIFAFRAGAIAVAAL